MDCVLEIADGNNVMSFRLQIDCERFAYVEFIIDDQDIQTLSFCHPRNHKVLATFAHFHKSLNTQSPE